MAKSDSAKPRGRSSGARGVVLVAIPLLGILAAAIWYAVRAWRTVGGVPISADGYIAMGLGIALSLAVGFGLMGLLFYSSRHGYDEPYRPPPDAHDDEG